MQIELGRSEIELYRVSEELTRELLRADQEQVYHLVRCYKALLGDNVQILKRPAGRRWIRSCLIGILDLAA